MVVKKYRGVLIDFDGVISRSSVDNIIRFVHQYISRHTPIAMEFIHSFIKNVASFPPDLTIPMLLKSLGLENQIRHFYEEFHEFDNSQKFFSIEPDFAEFIEFCRRNDFQYKIFSLANPARLKVIGSELENSVYSLKGKSKADPRTFRELGLNASIDLKQWIYLDDNPVALRTGKLEGLNTVMMLNNVYTENDFYQFRDFINYRVTSFKEFQNFLSEPD
jgi:hypothetical protein